MAVGALEPPFYAALLVGLGLADADLPAQLDRTGWPVLRRAFADVFAAADRTHWLTVFDGTDACVTSVLTAAEATQHPHLVARGTLVEVDGVVQAASAPRFSHTPAGPVPPRTSAASETGGPTSPLAAPGSTRPAHARRADQRGAPRPAG